ncbi:ankyrin repeat domain-containing protein [Inquilinus limosus]|uniref:ankyrin repeat domain-containing protein n=1 Tax=Inquilinus limosus TaxID=171674 RepID=UPI003F1606F0
MPKALKKLLPKNFEDLLASGDLAALKAVFETCEPDARGGYAKQTALAFDACPDELARWLVARGADLSAADTWGNTPLHTRARSRRGRIEVLLELGADIHSAGAPVGTPLHAAADSFHVENARLLLDRGARVDAVNREGLTPLELALRGCSNINLADMAALAETLLAAGAARTPRMKGLVEQIGQRFEFHRGNFNPEAVDAASAALDRLYALFDTPPVPRRTLHDGTLPITVRATRWQEQHQELWELLVPSSGPAATVQGEVIRITGRIWGEFERNGGANWDVDYGRMAEALLGHVQMGHPLPPAHVAEIAGIIAEIRRISGNTGRLAELAVAWVLANPTPVKLEPPPYSR